MLQISSFNLTAYRATIGSPTPEKDLATFIEQMQRVALQVGYIIYTPIFHPFQRIPSILKTWQSFKKKQNVSTNLDEINLLKPEHCEPKIFFTNV